MPVPTSRIIQLRRKRINQRIWSKSWKMPMKKFAELLSSLNKEDFLWLIFLLMNLLLHHLRSVTVEMVICSIKRQKQSSFNSFENYIHRHFNLLIRVHVPTAPLWSMVEVFSRWDQTPLAERSEITLDSYWDPALDCFSSSTWVTETVHKTMSNYSFLSEKSRRCFRFWWFQSSENVHDTSCTRCEHFPLSIERFRQARIAVQCLRAFESSIFGCMCTGLLVWTGINRHDTTRLCSGHRRSGKDGNQAWKWFVASWRGFIRIEPLGGRYAYDVTHEHSGTRWWTKDSGHSVFRVRWKALSFESIYFPCIVYQHWCCPPHSCIRIDCLHGSCFH